MSFLKRFFRKATRKRVIFEEAPEIGKKTIARLRMILFPPNILEAWSFVVGRTSVENVLANIKATKKRYKAIGIKHDVMLALKFLTEGQRKVAPTLFDFAFSDLAPEYRKWVNEYVLGKTVPKLANVYSKMKNLLIQTLIELNEKPRKIKPLEEVVKELKPDMFVDIWVRVRTTQRWMSIQQRLHYEFEPFRFFLRNGKFLPLMATRQHWTRFHFWIPIDTTEKSGREITIFFDPLWNMPLPISHTLYYPDDYLTILVVRAKWLSFLGLGSDKSLFEQLGPYLVDVLVGSIQNPLIRSAANFYMKYILRAHKRKYFPIDYYPEELPNVPLNKLFESEQSFYDHVLAYSVGIDRFKDMFLGSAYGRIWDSRPAPVWFNKQLVPENEGY